MSGMPAGTVGRIIIARSVLQPVVLSDDETETTARDGAPGPLGELEDETRIDRPARVAAPPPVALEEADTRLIERQEASLNPSHGPDIVVAPSVAR
ncbi:MAG: hypothetical protein R3C68_08275 [Myxococcota bacterium]